MEGRKCRLLTSLMPMGIILYDRNNGFVRNGFMWRNKHRAHNTFARITIHSEKKLSGFLFVSPSFVMFFFLLFFPSPLLYSCTTGSSTTVDAALNQTLRAFSFNSMGLWIPNGPYISLKRGFVNPFLHFSTGVSKALYTPAVPWKRRERSNTHSPPCQNWKQTSNCCM